MRNRSVEGRPEDRTVSIPSMTNPFQLTLNLKAAMMSRVMGGKNFFKIPRPFKAPSIWNFPEVPPEIPVPLPASPPKFMVFRGKDAI